MTHSTSPETITLKTFLEKSGLKHKRAAELYGTTYAYFRLLLCGARKVNSEKLKRLQDAVKL